jgi:hypothetical protein
MAEQPIEREHRSCAWPTIISTPPIGRPVRSSEALNAISDQ